MENTQMLKLELIPIVNLILILGGGILFVIRINDILKRVMDSNEKLSQTVMGLDKRLTVVETVCTLNHARLTNGINHAEGRE
jgi:hypothetical protein